MDSSSWKMSRLLGDALMWALAPLLLCYALARDTSTTIWKGLPPLRWLLRPVAAIFQVMACIQIVFFGTLFLQMAWSLFWIGMCRTSDFVQHNQQSATLRSFLDRYYWP